MIEPSRIALKDVTTGHYRFTRRFRQHYEKRFGHLGLDLSQPVTDELAVKSIMAKAVVSQLSEEHCQILAKALGLLEDKPNA